MHSIIGWPPNIYDEQKKQFWIFKRDPRAYMQDKSRGLKIIKDRCLVQNDVILVPRDIVNIQDIERTIDTIFPLRALTFPFCSYDIVPLENSIFERIIRSESIIRLSGIKQLSYLTGFEYDSDTGVEVVNTTYLETGYTSFAHTRMQHSLMVSLLMSYLLRDLSRYDYVNGVLAGAFHDIATPAGGEATAQISDEFDEEKNFNYVFHLFENVDEWKREYPEFDILYIASIIQNNGLVGNILDICDKIAYVALDCYHFAYAGDSPIRDFALKNPLFCDVMLNVRITPDRQNVYFEDRIALFYFLYARALEFEALLKKPSRKVNEYYIRSLIKKLLLNKIVSKRDLLTNSDEYLLKIIMDYFGEDVKLLIDKKDFLQVVVCSFSEIDCIIKECETNGWTFLGKEKLQGFNPNIDFLVKDIKGDIIPFKDAEPELAKFLDNMAYTINNYGLYFRTNKPQQIKYIEV